MRKFLIPLLFLLCFGSLVSANAQVNRLQARETEWKNYALPQSNFTRKIDPAKNFAFRVPSDWTQQGDAFIFHGPHSATLEILIQTIPEGYPLDEFFGATLQIVKDSTGDAESILTRKTQLQDVETRELVLVTPDEEGQLVHSVSWMTIKGPQALVFNLKVPVAHAAEVEPFFKALVQSVIFLGHDYPAFETVRNAAIKSPAPAPIHELESIVASLTGATSERESIITRLASLFSSAPDVAIDLLLDSRPLVRAAAVQALVRSNNNSLNPFLWEVLDDREPLVAEAAARALATSPDVVPDLLDHSVSGLHIETIARVWPFMTKEKRNDLLTILFKEIAVRRPPPPPAVAPPPAKSRPTPDVSVRVTELIPVEPGKPIVLPGVVLARTDPYVQIGALTLLVPLPAEDFKLPLARIMASNYDPLIDVGLQVAFARGEALPVPALLKLVSSSDEHVRHHAVDNLTLSATVSDIPQIEALISKNGSHKDLDESLKLAIRKITLRNEINSAKSDSQKSDIIRKAQDDPLLANFAWRFHCEFVAAGCSPTSFKPDFAVKPFGENLFAKKLRHYTAIPKPGETVEKFYETLHGLQMDSPRAQANLVLMMGNIRRMLGLELSAPAEAEALIDYTGIDPDAPIALGSWTAKDGADSTPLAQRKAIVLRVKDRARFERAVQQFQQGAGPFANLVDYIGIGSRAVAALPAVLPFSAQAVLETGPSKPSPSSVLRYSIAHDLLWKGLRDRMIEHVWLDSEWQAQGATTHIVYAGDTAIIAPDLPSIRDLLVNANSGSGQQFLGDNPEFQKALDSHGDAIYFSDFKAVFAEAGEAKKPAPPEIKESGSLKFAASSWENSHQLVYEESDWAKPLLPFDPKELTAPRELLPSSTIAYFLTKVDLPALWSWSEKLFSAKTDDVLPQGVAADYVKEKILPELGPECGVAVLGLPGLKTFNSGTWAGFCKLKNNKLADALKAGTLFGNVGATADVAELKSGGTSYFVAARNGFLVVSNTADGLKALDGKTNLAATRDYSRTAEKAPAGIIALGGYNLEAAITAASRNMTLEEPKATVANLLFSVASAFHSQNFYATINGGTVAAHSSVSTDREGRYSVADASNLARGANITYAVLEPRGVPIRDQNRVSSLVLRVRAKASGPIDNIKDDIKSATQIVEQKSPTELVVTVAERKGGAEKAIQLPVKDPALAEYLKPTPEIASDNQNVIAKAREIAGKDKDAWSVARKLADWTNQNLEWKHVVSATPVQTLATREADCSEFSALFVAMARSLGLPARMVSGLAYSGTAFGGHAWVEVWVGKWVELDPTWGTSFVDATHIRNTTNTLLTSAALNLIELEVLDARRVVADFQKSPRALAEHLMKAIPSGNKPEIEATIDLPTLTDERMGAGAWARFTDAERDRMWSAYRRTVNEIVGYSDENGESRFRLVHLEEKDDTAEAICITEPTDLLMKLRFARHNGVWHLMEVLQADTGLETVSEMLRPTITSIEKSRAGEKTSSIVTSDYVRVLLLMDKDSEKASALADKLLKSKPKDQGLRFLKAVALMDTDTAEEGEKLLTELSNEGLAYAVYKLAGYLSNSDDEKQMQQTLELYQRYTTMEPHDPRGFRELANAYQALDKPVETEAALRKALELDPTHTNSYTNLIGFLVLHDRIGEVRPFLDTADKYRDPDEDLLGQIMYDLFYASDTKPAEKLAASEPARMRTSVKANIGLGRIYTEHGRYVEALRLLNTAAQIDKSSSLPHVSLAMLYRKQSRWLAALRAADHAIALDAEDSEAHYQRACALARLGRLDDAMTALNKSVELDPSQTTFIADEEDLKPLAALPAFKKLTEPEKTQP